MTSPNTDDQLFQATYDRVAARYDDLWSRNVRTPNDRLTRALNLRRNERLVDLACGSGAATLPMMRLVSPGETVAVACRALGISTTAVYNAMRRRAGKTICPCFGQVVRAGFSVKKKGKR